MVWIRNKPWRRKLGRPQEVVISPRVASLVLSCLACGWMVWYQFQLLRSGPAPRPPRPVWIVAQSGPGRLGNQMFQFASALGVYYHRLRTSAAVFPDTLHFCIHPNRSFDKAHLSTIFAGPFPPCPEDIASESINLPERGYGLYEPFHTDCPRTTTDAMNANTRCVFTLGEYLQSFRYLEPAAREIRSALAFGESVQRQALEFLHKVVPSKSQTLVGVHVRRGDLPSTKYLQQAPESYFVKAMQYYVHRYPNVLFLVATDDLTWCTEQSAFRADNIVFLTPNRVQPEVDMAILAQCNHTIVSVGTFGWWAGWLSGGEVVYYKDAIVLSHAKNVGQISLNDYYPPTWIGMTG